MRDLHGDDYESIAVDEADRLIPDGVRRLAGAAVFLGLIAAMGLWSYRLGTRDAGEVPVIRAMEGPARIQPEDPGGVQAAHQGLEVNSVLAGRPAPMPRSPVAPEEPPALAAEDGPQGELVAAAPAVLAERVLEEEGELPVPPADDLPLPMPQADAAPDGLVAAAPEFAPAAAEPDTAMETAALPAAGLRPRSRPAGLAVARAKTAPVASAPVAAAPAPKPAAAPETPAAAPEAPAAVAAAPAPVREVSGVKAGTRLVQLGAFDSEEMTRQAWSQLVARNGDLLGGKSLYVERTTANARVFYRLRVAGFSDTEETRALCEALRGRGIACIPVTLQ